MKDQTHKMIYLIRQVELKTNRCSLLHMVLYLGPVFALFTGSQSNTLQINRSWVTSLRYVTPVRTPNRKACRHIIGGPHRDINEFAIASGSCSNLDEKLANIGRSNDY